MIRCGTLPRETAQLQGTEPVQRQEVLWDLADQRQPTAIVVQMLISAYNWLSAE